MAVARHLLKGRRGLTRHEAGPSPARTALRKFAVGMRVDERNVLANRGTRVLPEDRAPLSLTRGVEAKHIGLPAGACMLDLEGRQRHRNLRNAVPDRVPHFDPDLAENCGMHWLNSFPIFSTSSKS